MALETRAWVWWCFMRFPTTDGVGGNKTSPVVLRRLSYTSRVHDRGRRHIECTRETSWWSMQRGRAMTNQRSIRIPQGQRWSGTHQSPRFCGALHANSRETDGRRIWDAGPCVENLQLNQDRDETTRGGGNPRRKNRTRWESRVGWEMKGEELRSDSSEKLCENVSRDEKRVSG